jgi:hypothetical protein
MTHRIVVNVQTGETTQVEYTPEEQAIHDAAVAAQVAAEAQALAEAQAQQMLNNSAQVEITP